MTSPQLTTTPLATLFDQTVPIDRDAIVRKMRGLDYDLWTHARLVAQSAELLAIEMGLSGRSQTVVIDAAWVHDLGKLTIDRGILDKPGPLDNAEWSEMREHPGRAADFLRASPTLSDLAPLVRHHHERYDGTGYPGRVIGESIPLGARMIGVIDAFDAMTTERPYRAAMPVAAALDELRRCAGTQFDPRVVASFVTIATKLKRAP